MRVGCALGLAVDHRHRAQGGLLDEAPARVVPPAQVDRAALRAARAHGLQQAVLPVDDLVGVEGLLAQAVGEQGLAGGVVRAHPLQRRLEDLHLHALGGALSLAAHAEGGLGALVVLVGGQALLDHLAVAARADDADAGEGLGVAGVFVVVLAAQRAGAQRAVGKGVGALAGVHVGGQAHLDEVGGLGAGQGLSFGSVHTGRHGHALLVGEAAQGAVDALDAGEDGDGACAAGQRSGAAGLALLLLRRFHLARVGQAAVVEAQGAPLRVGHLEELALGAVLDGEHGAAGGDDLHELAAFVKAQAAPGVLAVGPVPEVFLLAAVAGEDLHPALGGVGAGAQAGVARVDVEDEAGAVGLQDLHGAPNNVQVGLVRQAPAHTELAEHVAVGAVVVAHDLQAEFAGQGGHVDFGLELVAVGEVDGVARASVHAAGVALRGRACAAAGGAAQGSAAHGSAATARRTTG